MYKKKKISISIPAYLEEKYIEETLTSIPKYVDMIVCVNDGSGDDTGKLIKQCAKKDKRIIFLENKKNFGLGYSILRASNRAIKEGSEIIVVIGGDNQMDLSYIPQLLDEIIENRVDYAKGNRFFHSKALREMPKVRLIGNVFVTFFAKIGSGYWSIADPLNGYTAIKAKTFQKLDQKRIGKRYDFEMSMLIHLGFVRARICDVFIPARYGDAPSTVKFFRDTYRVTKVFLKGFLYRYFMVYTLLRFHPIILFFVSGLVLLILGLISGVLVSIQTMGPDSATAGTVLIPVVFVLAGLQFLIQALMLDIQNEPK